MKRVWILIILMAFLTNRAAADDVRFQISLLSGFNHVFEYGKEEEYVMGENDFPVTPAHTPLSLGITCDYFLGKNIGVGFSGRFFSGSDLILRDPSDDDAVQIDSSRHVSVTANLLYRFMDKKVIPYAVMGIGLDYLLAEEGTYTSTNGYSVDIIAPEKTLDLLVTFGAGFDLFFSKSLGFRGDFRYLLLFSKPHYISNLNVMMGLFIGFGRGRN